MTCAARPDPGAYQTTRKSMTLSCRAGAEGEETDFLDLQQKGRHFCRPSLLEKSK